MAVPEMPGTAGSPVEFMQQCKPADEARSARNKRLDRNRQAARFAATKAARGKKVKPTALDFERSIVAAVGIAAFDIAASQFIAVLIATKIIQYVCWQQCSKGALCV